VVDFLATKTDIAQIKTKIIKEISIVRKEISEVETRLSKDISVKISKVQSDQKEQFKWFVTILITLFGVMITMMIYLITKIG